MGKQNKQNLKQTEKFITEIIGNDIGNLNINFNNEKEFYKSVSNLLKTHAKSSSIYYNENILNNYTKLYNKARVENIYMSNFIYLSEAVIVGSSQHPTYQINDDIFLIPIIDKWNDILKDTYKTNIEKAIKCVGRIEHPNNYLNNPKWSGTGWLYGDKGHLITNAHVANEFITKNNRGEFIFTINYEKNVMIQPYIDFKEEADNASEITVKIMEVCYVGDITKNEPDIAVLKVDTSNSLLQKGLSLETIPLKENNEIVIIGYPVDKSVEHNIAHTEEYINWIREIFKGKQGVKRISPGTIMKYYKNHNFLKHNCSTLTGNSGSPLINPITGNVIGMHYFGDNENYKYNLAISAKNLKEILIKLNI